MKKIDIGLDFSEILNRIEKEMEIRGIKTSGWGAKIGLSQNIVTNIHGKTKQKPSLEYIIAVARATRKPVEYYLYGENYHITNMEKNSSFDEKHIEEMLTMTRTVLKSETVYTESLAANIKSSFKALELEKRTSTLEDKYDLLTKKLNENGNRADTNRSEVLKSP